MVSPCLHQNHFGGVQASAQVAWSGLKEAYGSNASVLCYGKQCTIPHSRRDAHQSCSSSRAGVCLRALFTPPNPASILFWHISMLKVLPFLKTNQTEVGLFLHGIECWQPLDSPVDRLLRRVDLFLTNSDYTWSRFVQLNPAWSKAPHKTVHLGIADTIEGTAEPDGCPAALILGRMEQSEDYKGHREVINAWPEVLKNVPEAELWIAGGGNLQEELERLAAHNRVSASVRFLGCVPEKNKQASTLR